MSSAWAPVSALRAVRPAEGTFFFLAGEARSLIPLRRHLRLEKHQRMLLLSVMNMLHQAIGQWMAQTATEK